MSSPWVISNALSLKRTFSFEIRSNALHGGHGKLSQREVDMWWRRYSPYPSDAWWEDTQRWAKPFRPWCVPSQSNAGVLKKLLRELHLSGILTEDLAVPEDFNSLEQTYRGLCRRDENSSNRRIGSFHWRRRACPPFLILLLSRHLVCPLRAKRSSLNILHGMVLHYLCDNSLIHMSLTGWRHRAFS